MNEEEKKAIKKVKEIIYNPEYRNIILFDSEGFTGWNINFEIILNLIEKQQKEIENYQILKDDIEGHNVVYVDTPEFEENYISKDKIKEKIEKIKEDEEFYRERNRMYEFNGKINILKDLLGE